MGLIDGALGLLFGGGRNAIKETAEVFRVNAEASDARDAKVQAAVMQQFAAEFQQSRKHWFDSLIDGLNRVPRPALAIGTLALFISAMVDPIWFAGRMQGISLVPEPLWWLLGAIVSFYFGARHQAKGQEFQRSIAETMSRAGTVTRNISSLQALQAGAGGEDAEPIPAEPIDASGTGANPALDDWRRG